MGCMPRRRYRRHRTVGRARIARARFHARHGDDPRPTSSSRRSTGEPRTVAAWVTLFNLAVVVLDPYTYESAWLLDEAGRILTDYTAADVRVGWVVTASPDETKQFLGPWADELLTFADPDRAFVKGLGLDVVAGVRAHQHGGPGRGRRRGLGSRRVAQGGSQPLAGPRLDATGHPRPEHPAPYAGSPAPR